MKFAAVVIVECDTAEQASQVLTERIYHDEDYGFDYRINLDSGPVLQVE